MKNIIAKGPLFIFIAAFLWGLDGVLRRSLFTLPPIIIVFYEHLIGAILIAPFLIKQLGREKISQKTWGAIFWISLLSGVLGTLWFTTALVKVNFISFSVVFLLQKLQPLFAVLAAAVLLKEKITRDYLKWAAIAVLAAYFVTFPNGVVDFSSESGTIVAALFATGAAFAWGTSTAVSRYGLLRISHTTMTGLRFLITTPIAFLFVFLLGSQDAFATPSFGQFSRLFIIALSTGMVALWIYYKGLKLTQAKVSTIVELFFPATAVFIDIFLYKSVLVPTQYIAALVLLFSISKISKLNKQT